VVRLSLSSGLFAFPAKKEDRTMAIGIPKPIPGAPLGGGEAVYLNVLAEVAEPDARVYGTVGYVFEGEQPVLRSTFRLYQDGKLFVGDLLPDGVDIRPGFAALVLKGNFGKQPCHLDLNVHLDPLDVFCGIRFDDPNLPPVALTITREDINSLWEYVRMIAQAEATPA
jgi:hypothetical protein